MSFLCGGNTVVSVVSEFYSVCWYIGKTTVPVPVADSVVWRIKIKPSVWLLLPLSSQHWYKCGILCWSALKYMCGYTDASSPKYFRVWTKFSVGWNKSDEWLMLQMYLVDDLWHHTFCVWAGTSCLVQCRCIIPFNTSRDPSSSFSCSRCCSAENTPIVRSYTSSFVFCAEETNSSRSCTTSQNFCAFIFLQSPTLHRCYKWPVTNTSKKN